MALTLALRAACSRPAISTSPAFLQLGRFASSSLARSALWTPKQSANRRLLLQSVVPATIVRPVSLAAARPSAAAVAGQVGHHAKLWTVERAFSAGLLVALPACIVWPSQPLDLVVAVSVVMHAHWGLEAIVVDYVRPILVGNVVPKVAHLALIAFSAVTLAGLVYFIQNDVGIGQAVRQLWAIKERPALVQDPSKPCVDKCDEKKKK